MKSKYWLLSLMLSFTVYSSSASDKKLKILVFSKTAGFRHQVILKGIKAFQKLAVKNSWDIDYSEDSSVFDRSLFKYDVLVFLNTTGNILNEPQQEIFKTFMARGKGFVGIHAAADTEADWPWYNNLIGAVFSSHPAIQNATIKTSKNYASFFGTDYNSRQTRDEWYNFKEAVKPNVTVLTYLDENTYQGGTHNGDHPITWYHEYGGGRVFYTGLGHQEDQFNDETFLRELVTAINWTGGKVMK